jgi:hypothetical protein
MLWVKRIAFFLFSAAAIIALIVGYVSSPNDISLPFSNDGNDKDLRIINNAEFLTVYRDTAFCLKKEMSFPVLYHMYGIKNVRHFFHPPEIDIYKINMSKYNNNTSSANFFGEYRKDACNKLDRNNNNIYVTTRIALLKAPDKYRIWVRARQRNSIITFAIDRDIPETEYSFPSMGSFCFGKFCGTYAGTQYLRHDLSELSKTFANHIFIYPSTPNRDKIEGIER